MIRWLGAFTLAVLASCGSPSAPIVEDRPTWHRDIRPIVEAKCGECHGPGSSMAFNERSAPALAGAMLAAIESGLMPPWPPGPLGVPLLNARSVTPEELLALRAWRDSGREVGAPTIRELTQPPQPADMRLMMLSGYTSKSHSTDESRCFLLPPFYGTISGYRWVSGEMPKHHMGAVTVDAAGYAAASKLDHGDGWDCVTDWQVPYGNLLGSTGLASSAVSYPSGVGIPVYAGIVLQVHYVLPAGTRPPDRSGIDIWLGSGSSRPVREFVFSTPSEMTCPDQPGDSPASSPCSREYAIAHSIYPSVRELNEHNLRECGYQGVADYWNRSKRVGSPYGHHLLDSGCAVPSPIGGTIAALHIHAHTRTVAARLSVQEADGSWRVLLDIPRWRWVWEGSYVPLNAGAALKVGQPVRLDCAFDNGNANQWSKLTEEPGHDQPASPPLESPRYVVAGSERAAEMCTAILDVY